MDIVYHLQSILERHHVHLQVGHVCIENISDFIQDFIGLVYGSAPCKVTLDCISDLLQYFIDEIHDEGALRNLIETIPFSEPSGPGISKICSFLKNDRRFNLPISLHTHLLTVLSSALVNDIPNHIQLPGDQSSYLSLVSPGLFPTQVSINSALIARAYTLNFWIKFDELSLVNIVTLFRYRSTSIEIEGTLSNKLPNGSHTISIRISFATSTSRDGMNVSYDMTGTLNFNIGIWYLFTLKHTSLTSKSRAQFLVDGFVVIEQDVPYPTLASPTSNTQWIFGSNLKGSIASVCLYGEELDTSLIQLLRDAGPHVCSIHDAVCEPQSSYDSGHSKLGIRLSKGKAVQVRNTPLFALTARHFDESASLPLFAAGDLGPDQIKMIGHPYSGADKSACVKGNCVLQLQPTWSDSWIVSGGPVLILFLLSLHTEQSASSSSSSNASGNSSSSNGVINIEILCAYIRMIASVLRSSVEMRDVFLQQHGFHIIACCLRKLPNKSSNLDIKTVEMCFELVRALGVDAEEGDCIAAALQGLFFDFSLWGEARREVKSFLLRWIADNMSERAVTLYQSVGVQRILDVLRLHVLRSRSRTEQGDLWISESESSQEQTLLQCADTGHDLLCIAMDAALDSHQSAKASSFAEGDMLLLCLEETGSVLLAERILRSIMHLRYVAGTTLKKVLLSGRFAETTTLQLLTRSGYSSEVRRSTLILLLWFLNLDVEKIPDQLYRIRGEVVNLPTPYTPKNSRPGARNIVTSVANGMANGMVYQMDPSRLVEIVSQLRSLTKPLKHVWTVVCMLAEALDQAMRDGAWTNESGSGTGTAHAQSQRANQVIDVLDVFTKEGPLGRVNVWMILPLVSVMLSHSNLSTKIETLSYLSIAIKSEEWQVEALGKMKDKDLIGYFLRLLGSTSSSSSVSPTMSTSTPVSVSVTIDTVKSQFENMSINSGSGGHSNMETGNWTTVDSFGDVAITTDDSDQLLTCDELVLDLLATVITDKIRYHGMNAWKMWKELQYCLVERYGAGSMTGLSYLRRIVSLVLQKLTRGGEVWNLESLHCIGQLILLIEDRRLCGNAPDTGDYRDQSMGAAASLLPDIVNNVRVELSKEERCLLSFLVDLTAGLRKSATNGVLGGSEAISMLSTLRILLACLQRVDSIMGDRIASEILAIVTYLCDPWGFGENAVEFRKVILKVFTSLRVAIKDPSLPVDLRFRLEATMILLVNIFVKLRNPDNISNATSGRNRQYTENRVVGEHTALVIDAMMSAQGIVDVNALISVLEVTLRAADSISFADEDDDMVSITAKRSTTSTNTNATKDIPTISTASLTSGAVIDFLTSAPVDIEIELDGKPEDIFAAPNWFPHNRNTTEDNSNNNNINKKNKESPSRIQSLSPPLLSSQLPPPPLTLPSDLLLTVFQTPSEKMPYSSTSKDSIGETFSKWVQIRTGILQERIDTERGRLSMSMESLDFAAEATSRFWSRQKRKIESEIFHEEHICEWKLGVAHEGAFPSRKRIVLRPKFQGEGSERLAILKLDGDKISNMDAESLKQALARACVGYIKDVRSAEAATVDEDSPGDTVIVETTGKVSGGGGGSVGAPGSGWGMVDADGSEEGYGVVGVAQEGLEEGNKAYGNDRAGGVDIRQLEEDRRQGRLVETGPCHHGTRHVNGGPVIQSCAVYLITPSGNYHGLLSFNSREIYFTSDKENQEETDNDTAAITLVPRRRMRRRRWVLAAVCAVYLRRYRLRDSALEIFLRRGKHRNFFVDFGHTKDDAKRRNSFAHAFMRSTPKSAVKQWPGTSMARIIPQLNVQELWLNGDLSNLDYLMALNTLSGRSYSDLTQYPVMPWVIAQYNKDTIDLSDPNTFRDLSKPIGALNQSRLNDFMQRYKSLGETDVPPFMYGSHYSTMVGVVLHYLVRLQPFAALHQDIQNGHFDVSDRLFSSIPRTWDHNTTMLSEVKELTPEWFLLPEFLKNINGFDLGVMQDGEPVNDVELPPWAATAEEFIRINREALESDYVSAHLHEWIDLIFGYKQKGPEAVEAHNVFYYLTYYGSVDRDMISDDALRRATELQIAHFGQCPMQLFPTPHPARRCNSLPRPLRRCFDEYTQSLVEPVTDEESLATVSLSTLVPRLGPCPSTILDMIVLTGRIICILQNGVIEVYRYGVSDAAKTVTGTRLQVASRQLEAARRLRARLQTRLRRRTRLIRGPPSPQESLMATTSTGPGALSSDKMSRRGGGGGARGGDHGHEVWDSQGIISFDDEEEQSQSHAQSHAKTTTVGGSSATATIGRDRRTSSSAAISDRRSSVSKYDSEGSSSSIAAPSSGGGGGGGGGNTSATASASISAAVTTVTGDSIEGDYTSTERGRAGSLQPEIILVAEKDTTHFDVVPRIPLAHRNQNNKPKSQLQSQSQSQTLQKSVAAPSTEEISEVMQTSHLIHFTQSQYGSLVLSAGRRDGAIAVRELDPISGVVRSAGDFKGHKHAVVAVSSDCIPGGSTDVIASCDIAGIILIWTITSDRTSNSRQISRRPQRLFRCLPGPVSCCDLSWQMGILVGSSQGIVFVFSIERNERLHVLDLRQELCVTVPDADSIFVQSPEVNSPTVDSYGTTTDAAAENNITGIGTGTGAVIKRTAREDVFGQRCAVIHICLCNDGMILTNVEVYPDRTKSTTATAVYGGGGGGGGDLSCASNSTVGSRGDIEIDEMEHMSLQSETMKEKDNGNGDGNVDTKQPSSTTSSPHRCHKSKTRHFLICHTVAGVRTGLLQLPARVTCMSCPGRGGVLVSGHADGSVRLFDAHNLELLFEYKPHLAYSRCPVLDGAGRAIVPTPSPAAAGMSSTSSSSLSTDPIESFIVNIRVGPELERPVVMCVTTGCGAMYIRPLPDYLRWEKTRNITSLSQIVSMPLQVVRGSIQQAQAWTTDTAGVLAENAKTLSDEAFKKVMRYVIRNIA